MTSPQDKNIEVLWRLEDRTLKGPWHGGRVKFIDKKYYKFHDLDHVPPCRDPLLREAASNIEDYILACNSLTQLLHWFTRGDIKEAREKGFMVNKLYVKKEDIVKGRFQTLVRKRSVMLREPEERV